jgi:hypothetical protein
MQIENVLEFKYLGRVVNNKDDDRPTVMENLKKARMKWGRISRILSRDGANPKAMASFYKAIVQLVFLYGSELWVLTLSMEKELQSFVESTLLYYFLYFSMHCIGTVMGGQVFLLYARSVAHSTVQQSVVLY